MQGGSASFASRVPGASLVFTGFFGIPLLSVSVPTWEIGRKTKGFFPLFGLFCSAAGPIASLPAATPACASVSPVEPLHTMAPLCLLLNYAIRLITLRSAWRG